MIDLPPSARRPKVQPYYLDTDQLRFAYQEQLRVYQAAPNEHRFLINATHMRLDMLREAETREAASRSEENA